MHVLNASLIFIISLIGIVYVGMLTSAQKDMKRLIAYASISHMGFVTLGLFSIYFVDDPRYAILGLMGAIIVMIAHALSSGALFLSFGMMYSHLKTSIEQLRGLYQIMPLMGSMFLVYVMSTVGLPKAGFVGEWMVTSSTVAKCLQEYWLQLQCDISCLYVRVYQKVFYGMGEGTVSLNYMQCKSYSCNLASAIFIMGLYPNLLIDKMQTPVENLIYFTKLKGIDMIMSLIPEITVLVGALLTLMLSLKQEKYLEYVVLAILIFALCLHISKRLAKLECGLLIVFQLAENIYRFY